MAGTDEDDNTTKFRERFGSALIDVGMPRMPGRVFSALFTCDSGRLTSAELAEILQVSPAAISGAVRYLGQLGMVSREREPGSRRDHYVVRDDLWQRTMTNRDQLIARLEVSIREGMALVGEDSPAGARAANTLAFLEFLQSELTQIFDRWFEQQRSAAADLTS